MLDKDRLTPFLTQKLIGCQKHPDEDLYIYNYTPKAQYTNTWTEETMTCRGLITDSSGHVLSRPFKKFFNLDQYTRDVGPLPDEPFEVFDKLDGCFLSKTPLNLWGGGTVAIGKVVNGGLSPTLMGMDNTGAIVPCQVLDRFHNGRRDNWLDITVDCVVSRASGAAGHPNRIRVTGNHHLFVNGKYTPAAVVRVGDNMVTAMPTPSPEVLHVITSSLLGDGSIALAASRQEVAVYQEGHSTEHMAYVKALRHWLGACGTIPGDTISGYGSPIAWAQSRNYRALRALRAEWYPQGKKIIPSDLSWIDDFSIAKWYMDDGSLAHSDLQQDRAVFSTNAHTRTDVERLAQKLRDMYDVDAVVQESKGWTIRVNAGRARTIDALWEAIAPHIVPVMRYKLPEQYRTCPYVERERGEEHYAPRQVRVLAVEHVENTKKNFSSGRTGFDIHTTTGNYFAKGVLVHNSLGISYFVKGIPYIATRGSFTSEQAGWANKMLRHRYPASFAMTKHITYLFEIIVPQNRIVVDYGPDQKLVLLAAFRTDSGEELSHWELGQEAQMCGFPLVQRFETPGTIEALKAVQESNREGFVLRFKGGLRVKLKMIEYLRIHRIVTNVSSRTIWERLRDGQALEELLDRMPDDFFAFVANTTNTLWEQFVAKQRIAILAYEAVRVLPTRKEQALQLAQFPEVRAAVFKMLDNQPYEYIIWKYIEPKFERP